MDSGLQPETGQPRGGTGGFTLIELAVVLAIVGMVLAVAVPRLPSAGSGEPRSSAVRLASALRYAQETAAVTGGRLYLNLEPGGGGSFAEPAADGAERAPSDPFLSGRLLADGVAVADILIPRLGRVADHPVRLVVQPHGLRDFVAIHLRAANGDCWSVIAYPSGGKSFAVAGCREDGA